MYFLKTVSPRFPRATLNICHVLLGSSKTENYTGNLDLDEKQSMRISHISSHYASQVTHVSTVSTINTSKLYIGIDNFIAIIMTVATKSGSKHDDLLPHDKKACIHSSSDQECSHETGSRSFTLLIVCVVKAHQRPMCYRGLERQ